MKNLESFSVLEMKAKEMTEIQGGILAAILVTVLATGVVTMLGGTVLAVSGEFLKYPD